MGRLLQHTEQMRLEGGQSQRRWKDSLGIDTWHTNSLVTAHSPTPTVTDNLGENQSLTPKVLQSNCNCQTLPAEKEAIGTFVG